MKLKEWATRWGISAEALSELPLILNASGYRSSDSRSTTESWAQHEVQLEATERGGILWRNNVGAGTLENGSFVRWGLANESKAMNNHNKSSDLIGIMPVYITGDMVGKTIGQFVAREIKRPGWKWGPTKREIAQANYMTLVNTLGGNAMFATGRGTL